VADLARDLELDPALAASVTTRALAAQLGMDPEQAFLAGLVHDVGRMVILQTAGEIQRRSRGRFCPDPLALERVIEELHPLLGGVVVESWHLGGSMALAIAQHHDPAAAPESVRPLACLIEVAHELGRSIANGSALGPQGNQVAVARLEQFGLSDAVSGEIVAEAYEGFRELFKIL